MEDVGQPLIARRRDWVQTLVPASKVTLRLQVTARTVPRSTTATQTMVDVVATRHALTQGLVLAHVLATLATRQRQVMVRTVLRSTIVT